MNKKAVPVLIRIVLGAGAALWLFGFISLFVSGASRNIGSFTGIVLGFLVLFYALFMPSFHKSMKRVWEKKGAGKKVQIIVLILSMLILLTAITETVLMCTHANRNAPSSSRPPVVIVLGCQVRNGAPSMLLQERIDTAYEYLIAHPECSCIVSGGKGSDEAISEAKCMHDELVKMGIEESRIYMEDRSTSTRENLQFSKEIMEKEDLGDTALLITNSWHEFRAQVIASDLSIPCGGIGAGTPWWLLPSFYLRELYGILYQFVF
ncbi:MAG: YdcF family protein [Clostridiales bacterium]|nr:YdcF family protein [Clostridiales bacterium]